MGNRKAKQRPTATRRRNRKNGSAGKAIAFLAVGVALAMGLALYLASGGSTPTTDTSPLMGASTGGHVRGPENAVITLTEYGDYECPTCAGFHPVVAELMRRMPDELEFEFHHYPIPVGANSVTASLAAEAAGEQGRFWEMHDALFETQGQWTGRDDAVQLFVSMAGQLGLDSERFLNDLQSAEIQGRIVRDHQQGASLGVTGTPTFFIAGRRLDFLPGSVDEFQAIIRSVMAQ